MDWNNINTDRDTSGLGPIEYDQSKVPALIRKHADNVRTKTYGQEVREAQARNAELAGLIASEAVDISHETKGRQDTVETQFNSIQQELTDKDPISAPEIIVARNGEPTLSDRLDKEHQNVTAQLAQKGKKFHNVEEFKHLVPGINILTKPELGDWTKAVQAACDIGGYLYFPFSTYLMDTVLIEKPMVMNLGSSTIKRFTKPSGIIFNAKESFEIFNGKIDGENQANNRGMLINFAHRYRDFRINHVDFMNQCLGGRDTPVASQDTDLVNIEHAKTVYINDSKFNLASRQGVSLTGYCDSFIIENSHFEDCYLFGFDAEINNPEEFKVKHLELKNITFKNCGIKDATRKVWDSGGPFNMTGPTSKDVKVFKDILIRDVTVMSGDFIIPSVELVEPFISVQQYDTLSVRDSHFDTVNRIVFGDENMSSKVTTVMGNTFHSDENNMSTKLYVDAGGTQHLNNNTYINAEVTRHNSKDKFLNGNFKEGLEYWLSGTNITDGTVSKNTLVFTGKGSNNSAKTNQVYQENVFTSGARKYYISLFAKNLSGGENRITCGYGFTSSINELLSNVYKRFSVLTTVDASKTDYSNFSIGANIDKKTGVRNVVVLDLTEIFGSGNEPTKEQMDDIFRNGLII